MVVLIVRIRKSSMRILIVRVSALGDAIHTLPALDVLKKYLPHAHIDWVVQNKIINIVKHVPGIESIYTLNDRYLHPQLLAQTFQTLIQLRTNDYDLVIDFQGLCKTSILLLGIDSPNIGFDSKSSRERLSSIAHTYTINVPTSSNIIEKNIALALAAINILTNKKTLEFEPITKPLVSAPQPSNQALEKISDWIASKKAKPLLLLTPNTTWDSKHWPIERWEELAYKLSCVTTHTIVLVGQNFGPQGSRLATYIQEHNLPIIVAPAWSLDELFAVMKFTDIIIAPDTGLLHIADSLGVATIGLYGPTKISRHGPQITHGNQSNCLQATCPHDYQKNHGLLSEYSQTQDCMLTITTDMVLEKIYLKNSKNSSR